MHTACLDKSNQSCIFLNAYFTDPSKKETSSDIAFNHKTGTLGGDVRTSALYTDR